MGTRAAGAATRSVRTLLESGTCAGLSDNQVLEKYLLGRGGDASHAAFRVLVERHGHTVMSTCRAVVRNQEDAEDAFQATFLILARKAATIHKGDSVASWLFGVARRVALRARAQRWRLVACDGSESLDALAAARSRPNDPANSPDPEVREEVERLPERYRVPILLCYWNGLTHEQAAVELRVAPSTIRVRLMRGRLRLRDRLIRRGLGPAAFIRVLSGRSAEAVSVAVVDEIAGNAARIASAGSTGFLRPQVAVLFRGVIRAMFYAKLKTTAVLLAGLLAASILMMSSLAGPVTSKRGEETRIGAAAAAVDGERPGHVERPAEQGDGREVSVEAVKRSRWERITSQQASVAAFAAVDVYAKASGFLSMLNVDIGSRVKRGDVIAEVSDPELRIAVDKARAEVMRAQARVAKARAALSVSQAAAKTERARIRAAASAVNDSAAIMKLKKSQSDRINELAERRAVDHRIADEQAGEYQATAAKSEAARSQLQIAEATGIETEAKIEETKADVAETEAELQIANAGLQSAQVSANYTRVIAPFDGVVTCRNYHVGQFVSSPSAANINPIVTIVQTQTMRVLVHVPEADAPYVDVGDRARMTIDSLGELGVFEGVVSRTGYAYDTASRTLRAEIDLPNQEGRLRPGQHCRATINLAAKENVLSIPGTAILEYGGPGQESVCYRVVGGHALRTRVRLGERNGNRFEVLKGLSEGDVVVAKNPEILSDDLPVTVKSK